MNHIQISISKAKENKLANGHSIRLKNDEFSPPKEHVDHPTSVVLAATALKNAVSAWKRDKGFTIHPTDIRGGRLYKPRIGLPEPKITYPQERLSPDELAKLQELNRLRDEANARIAYLNAEWEMPEKVKLKTPLMQDWWFATNYLGMAVLQLRKMGYPHPTNAQVDLVAIETRRKVDESNNKSFFQHAWEAWKDVGPTGFLDAVALTAKIIPFLKPLSDKLEEVIPRNYQNIFDSDPMLKELTDKIAVLSNKVL